jgi:transposase
VVVCIDEKTGLQAKESVQITPLLPGITRMERRDFEYRRHGAINLMASLEVHTGHVEAMLISKSSNQEFVEFLDYTYNRHKDKNEIHIIVDNASIHKHDNVIDWLIRHHNVHLHKTPTHASWLNQIELWFSILQRQKLKRSNFTSLLDLIDQFYNYLEQYNQKAKPFQWTYKGKPLQI